MRITLKSLLIYCNESYNTKVLCQSSLLLVSTSYLCQHTRILILHLLTSESVQCTFIRACD